MSRRWGQVVIGLSCTLVALVFRGLRVDQAYRGPWVHGGLGLSALAMVGVTIDMLLSGATSFLAALAFLLVSATAVLANIEERKEALGYLSLLSANVSAALGLVTADVTWHWVLGFERYAVVAGLAGLIEVSLGALLGLITREEGPRKPLRSYVWPLRQLGLIVAAVGVGLCAWRLLGPIEVQDTNTLIEIAAALGSSAAAFAIGTAVVYSAQWLAFATVWTAVAAYFCWCSGRAAAGSCRAAGRHDGYRAGGG